MIEPVNFLRFCVFPCACNIFLTLKFVKIYAKELHVLAQYHHPSVVALKGFIPPAYSTPNLPLPLLALEYAKYGSLGKLLKDTAQLPVEARKSALPLALKHRFLVCRIFISDH